VALVFAVGRAGVRLPMQALFKVSTVVLLATAVVLLGEGLHSFEEVGILPSLPMAFPRIEFLGIYPDRIGVFAQLALAAVPLVWKATRRWAERKSALKNAVEPGQ
jgi:high-affinity iron transporter